MAGGGRREGINFPDLVRAASFALSFGNTSYILLVLVIIKIVFVNGQMMDPFNWKKNSKLVNF